MLKSFLCASLLKTFVTAPDDTPQLIRHGYIRPTAVCSDVFTEYSYFSYQTRCESQVRNLGRTVASCYPATRSETSRLKFFFLSKLLIRYATLLSTLLVMPCTPRDSSQDLVILVSIS